MYAHSFGADARARRPSRRERQIYCQHLPLKTAVILVASHQSADLVASSGGVDILGRRRPTARSRAARPSRLRNGKSSCSTKRIGWRQGSAGHSPVSHCPPRSQTCCYSSHVPENPQLSNKFLAPPSVGGEVGQRNAAADKSSKPVYSQPGSEARSLSWLIGSAIGVILVFTRTKHAPPPSRAIIQTFQRRGHPWQQSPAAHRGAAIQARHRAGSRGDGIAARGLDTTNYRSRQLRLAQVPDH